MRKEKEPEEPKPSSDSITKVYQTLHGGRTVVSLRMKPEVKEAFSRRCRQLGLSTCHVAEGLISGWLMGIGEQVELVNHCPTINQVLVRDVVRRRRVAYVYDDDVVREKEFCVVCGAPAFGMVFEGKKSQVLCMAHFTGTKHKGGVTGWKAFQIQ